MLDIRLKNLRKEFNKEVVAVRDLDMIFAGGTTTCLLGPSGCGKTTLMRIIAGLETPTHGDVYFGDERVTNMSTSQRNIGMVFQYPVVYRGISTRKNIELPLKQERLTPAERQKRVDEVVDLLELGDSVRKDMTELDNGTLQKVAVARAVARQPRIILFDEPITNVDISAKLQLKRALKELITRLNQTIIYVTHDQTEAMTLADKIALMKDGSIVQYATPRELYNNPDDVFGGWFLGNPGMNFFEEIIQPNGDSRFQLPLFPTPVLLEGAASTGSRLTLGVRPEHVQVHRTAMVDGVAAELQSKAIVVGGQYLLTLQIGEQRIKAKVSSDVGREMGEGETVWAVFPLDRVRLFGDDGYQPNLFLKI